MHNDARYCIKFTHFLQLGACLVLGSYAFVDSGNLFGLFALCFVPPVYLLLLVGLVLDWWDWSWC